MAEVCRLVVACHPGFRAGNYYVLQDFKDGTTSCSLRDLKFCLGKCPQAKFGVCLLETSDAADDATGVESGGGGGTQKDAEVEERGAGKRR